jgi:MFS family permease
MTNAALTSSPDPWRWRALTVSLAGAFMVLLDVSIVNVALPSIEREFGISASTVQWVVSGYALAFGLALVPAGRLGDTIGRRRMFLIALSAFVLTSALTGAAQTTGWLLAARLLQGVAGGMLIPQNVGLVQDLFRGAERARAFGVLGSVVGLSTATGPVVGGLILSLAGSPDGWRWVFYVNVPIGLVALVLAARLVPARSAATTRDTHLDLVGSLRSGLAVTPFALGSAVAAVFTGRAVPRFGRWLSVSGLLVAAIGMVATALVLRTLGGDAAAWAAAGPLLVAGLGGGMVTSPNTTLTLESVPAQAAGAAGGALQTAQRIGAALGTALLATVYYHALTSSGRDFPAAVSDALLCAAGLMLLALVIAVAELIERRRRSVSPAPQDQTGTAAVPATPPGAVTR